MPVNSVPLSETEVLGLALRRAITASNSCAPRVPDRGVSATSARHSRVQSSTIARMRNLFAVRQSDTKSGLQRLVWARRKPVRRSHAKCQRAPAALPHGRAFLTVEPPEPLPVHVHASPTQNYFVSEASADRTPDRELRRARQSPSLPREPEKPNPCRRLLRTRPNHPVAVTKCKK